MYSWLGIVGKHIAPGISVSINTFTQFNEARPQAYRQSFTLPVDTVLTTVGYTIVYYTDCHSHPSPPQPPLSPPNHQTLHQ